MFRKLIGRLALIYAALVLVLGCLTAVFDIVHLHDQAEHLLPDLLLAFVTLPASLLLRLVPLSSVIIRYEVAQVAFVTLGGLVQAAGVFYLARPRREHHPDS